MVQMEMIMMNDEKIKAYRMAREAAMLDYDGAVQGIIQGQRDIIEGLEEKLFKTRWALTQALALNAGKPRGDLRETFVQNIIDVIGKGNCDLEKDFVKKETQYA